MRGEIQGIIDPATQESITKCHNDVRAIAAGDAIVYGINTGFGPLCNTRISKEKTTDLQTKILLSHSVGVGKHIAPSISKLMLILKVHALAKGYSGISMTILNRILWHIDHEVIPVVPEQGSVGASGDLAPLAHLFLPLIGEGYVHYKGEIHESILLLTQFDLGPIVLHPKAGLALINGTQFIAAHAVVLLEKLYLNLAQADIIGAMMIEGLLGSKMPFHPKLHAIRPYRSNLHVADRIFNMLNESEIGLSHLNCDKVQDPYSIRCIPQVHGSSRNAWLHLKEALEIELNAVTDNPIIFSQELTISGGNFHGQPLALPLDYACLAASELGSISDRRIYLSLEGKSEDTPKLLMKETGLNSGFMILQYTSAALASENKGLCFPSSADSIPTSLGQEDHVSMGSIGARKALQVCNNVTTILAIEMLCAAQALDFKLPRKPGSILSQCHDHIRSKISHASEDRIFSKDIELAIEILHNGELLNISKEYQTINDAIHHELFDSF